MGDVHDLLVVYLSSSDFRLFAYIKGGSLYTEDVASTFSTEKENLCGFLTKIFEEQICYLKIQLERWLVGQMDDETNKLTDKQTNRKGRLNQ